MNISGFNPTAYNAASPITSLPPVSSLGQTGSIPGSPDTSSVTTLGQLWHTLSELRTQNPQAFSTFAQNAASELTSAAANQPAGKTKEFLNGLSHILSNAASNPNSPLQFANKGTGQYVPRDHPVAEEMMQSLNQQASSLLSN